MDSFTWRRVLVTVSMMVLAFVGAGAATAVVIGRDATQDAGAAADRAKRSASPSPSPSRTPTASPTAPRPGFRCWNGRSARKLSDCPEPEDRQSLEWVFPAFAKLNASSDCEPRRVGPLSIGRQYYFECPVLVDDKPVTYRFTRWRSKPESRKHYEVDEYPKDIAEWSKFKVKGQVAGTRYELFGRHEDSNKFRLSVSYANGLWSMSVESSEPDVIDRAFSRVVFRAPDRLRGEPVD